MIQQALDNAVLVKPDLWSVKHIFNSDVLETILNQLDLEKSWEKQPWQEHFNRLRLCPGSAILNNIIHPLFANLDFSRFGLVYKSATIWKDYDGYTIPQHADNDEVVGSMQIYLNDAPQNLGTWFEEDEIPFIKNTGYIMFNKNKPFHGMKHSVPNDVTRYSLYVWLKLI